MKKRIMALIVVAALCGAAFYIYNSNNRNPSGILRVSGNIEATTVETSFRIPGRVKERLVDEGEMVRAGQLVARLESDDITQEVAQRKAEVQNMRALVAELEAGSRSEEIAQGEAQLARVQADASRLKTDFARQQELYKKEVISTRDFDASRAANEAAQAAVREASERLRLLRKGPRAETIAQAKARLHASEAALALAATRLGYTTLNAPSAGMVMAKNVEPGEQVAAGTPVVTIGQLDSVWVRAYIPETDLGRVKVGQKAMVKSDTYPDKKYEGTISFIATEAEFTPKNVQTEKERVKLVYRIKITIPNPHMELKPGMPVDGEIVVK